MRFSQLVRGTMLVSGLLVLPGGAWAGAPSILQGIFSFDDVNAGSSNCVAIEAASNEHEAGGVVTGTGLNGDTVVMTWIQDFVDKASIKTKNIIVREKEFTTFMLDITPGAGSSTNVYNGVAQPEKGKSIARVIRGGAQARAAVKFDLEEGFSELAPALDPDQQTTWLAAFQDRNDVKIKEKNGQLKISHRGDPSGGCP